MRFVQQGVFSMNRIYYEAIKRGLLIQYLGEKKFRKNPTYFDSLVKNDHFIEASPMYLVLWRDKQNEKSNDHDGQSLQDEYYQEAAIMYLIERAYFEKTFKNIDFLSYVKRKMTKIVQKRLKPEEKQKWTKISSFINKMNQ